MGAGEDLLSCGRVLLELPVPDLGAVLATLPPDELEVAESALALATQAEVARRYLGDPVGWINTYMAFPDDEGLTPYQADALAELVTYGRLAIRGPHGLGKTTLLAWAVLWFAQSREAAGIRWKVPTTASAWRQLQHYLWPEIHVWAHRLRWDLLGRAPWGPNELQVLRLRLRLGGAWAQSTDNPALIEGAHAPHILYVYDEAKMIPDAIWDASEGAFAGSGARTDQAWAMAASTPGPPAGRFYQISRRAPGFSDWRTRHVTLDEAIAAGRVSRQWAEARAAQWGRRSTIYVNRVQGEFAASPEKVVIPLDWVEAANERWQALAGQEVGPLTDIGVDVAREGGDKTVIQPYCGLIALAPIVPDVVTGIELAGVITPIMGHHPSGPVVMIDAEGVGASALDQLRSVPTLVDRIVAFHAGGRTEWTDRSGELHFANLRAAAWWHLRELLDPDHDPTIALPPDDFLIGDLTAPEWRYVTGGPTGTRILVEAKDEIRKRIGRSTDHGDAAVQGAWGAVAGAVALSVPADSHRSDVRDITAGLLDEPF